MRNAKRQDLPRKISLTNRKITSQIFLNHDQFVIDSNYTQFPRVVPDLFQVNYVLHGVYVRPVTPLRFKD